jgi:hypothetical protein
MAVEINDFEVVPGEGGDEKSGGSEKGGGKKTPPSEHEIARLVEHRISRDERVWAH